MSSTFVARWLVSPGCSRVSARCASASASRSGALAMRSRAAVGRRGMASSSGHGPVKKSDTPWLITSGTITVLGVAYLITPPSKKAAHHAAVVAHPVESAHPPVSSEGAEIRGERSTGEPSAAESESESTEEGEEVNEEIKKAEPVEGVEASDAVVKSSSGADTPKDAEAAEESGVQESVSNSDKPLEGESKPTDIGQARETTEEQEAAKEAA